MTTRLVRVGEGLALILDSETWKHSGIDEESDLEVDLGEAGVHVRKSPDAHREKVLDSARRMMKVHEETFRKLAFMSVEFLTLDDVSAIHHLQLERFGGSSGLRDGNLHESAVAQPKASFGGVYLNGDLAEMAAAYLYSIVKNHPFLDGNKRTRLWLRRSSSWI